ncbi:excalibur calcium-binding domain-containing protein [Kribbella sp. CA-245084]|uniref:excalibur calcium-binding domain-containing protein n=1 Tax=Kribbella sp. CA-245084 TaxID=3239940 RepID=UPI003D911242
MRQFNTPPEWPDPPTPGWRPPRRWQPPKSWPKAPDRWVFWVDEHGRAVRGPIGRYGGPRRLTTLAIVAVPTALMVLVLLNPFSSSESTSTTPVLLPTVPASTAQAERSEKPARAERTPTIAPVSTRPSTQTTTEATPRSTPGTEAPVTTPAPATTAPTLPTLPTPSAVPTASSTTVAFQDCAEARAAGKAPLHRGDPGYSPALDHNGDGVACERGNS